QISGFWPVGVDLSDQRGDRYASLRRNLDQRLEEGLFEREAGAVAADRYRALDDVRRAARIEVRVARFTLLFLMHVVDPKPLHTFGQHALAHASSVGLRSRRWPSSTVFAVCFSARSRALSPLLRPNKARFASAVLPASARSFCLRNRRKLTMSAICFLPP